MLERITNSVFKSNFSVAVEYHAGGAFVRKQVAYLIFTESNEVHFFEREEGLHPYDDEYNRFFDGNNLIWEKDVKTFKITEENENILTLANSNFAFKCLPSKFIENVNSELISEIVVDKYYKNPQIFSRVYQYS